MKELMLREIRSHLEPIAGELASFTLQITILSAMWVITMITTNVQLADGKAWSTAVRWICNLRLTISLATMVVIKARGFYREAMKPWVRETKSVPHRQQD